MKIILLHGDHEIQSRDRLHTFIKVAKKRGWEVINTADVDQDVTEILSSQGLFAQQKLVICEDVKEFTKKRVEWIENKRKEVDSSLVIYHKGLLSKTVIKKLPKPDKIEEFKLPKEIWTFVGSIFPGNTRNVLTLFASVIENEPSDFVFAVIAKQFRDMYWVLVDYQNIPYPNWRKGKLKSQANKFNKAQLLRIYRQLAEIDIKVKTSKAEIKNELELLFATELQ